MDLDEEDKETIKVILIGNEGVGKTNLINVASGRAFNENEKSSLTASYLKKLITLNDKNYIISLWDTIGQEKLRTLSKLFFKNSKIVIYVYDITNYDTFKGLASWDKDVNDMIGNDVIKAVLGNKQDLYLKEQVTEEEASKYAQTLNAKFTLTSAKKDPEGISVFLEELLKEYIDKNTKSKDKGDLRSASIIIKNKKKKEKNGCC
jgi:small GTP-binding protein